MSASEVLKSPVPARKCVVCGHYECPCCDGWCDVVDGAADAWCCDTECRYDAPVPPEMVAFYISIPDDFDSSTTDHDGYYLFMTSKTHDTLYPESVQ